MSTKGPPTELSSFDRHQRFAPGTGVPGAKVVAQELWDSFTSTQRRSTIMGALRKYWWKILLLSVFATFIDILGHILDGTSLPKLPLSVVSQTIGMRATVVLYFLIWFSILSVMCLCTENWLSGSRLMKGVKYGIAFGVIMYFAACETDTIFGTPSVDDLRIAAINSIAFFIFGILAGTIFWTDGLTRHKFVAQGDLVASCAYHFVLFHWAMFRLHRLTY